MPARTRNSTSSVAGARRRRSRDRRIASCRAGPGSARNVNAPGRVRAHVASCRHSRPGRSTRSSTWTVGPGAGIARRVGQLALDGDGLAVVAPAAWRPERACIAASSPLELLTRTRCGMTDRQCRRRPDRQRRPRVACRRELECRPLVSGAIGRRARAGRMCLRRARRRPAAAVKRSPDAARQPSVPRRARRAVEPRSRPTRHPTCRHWPRLHTRGIIGSNGRNAAIGQLAVEPKGPSAAPRSRSTVAGRVAERRRRPPLARRRDRKVVDPSMPEPSRCPARSRRVVGRVGRGQSSYSAPSIGAAHPSRVVRPAHPKRLLEPATLSARSTRAPAEQPVHAVDVRTSTRWSAVPADVDRDDTRRVLALTALGQRPSAASPGSTRRARPCERVRRTAVAAASPPGDMDTVADRSGKRCTRPRCRSRCSSTRNRPSRPPPAGTDWALRFPAARCLDRERDVARADCLPVVGLPIGSGPRVREPPARRRHSRPTPRRGTAIRRDDSGSSQYCLYPRAPVSRHAGRSRVPQAARPGRRGDTGQQPDVAAELRRRTGDRVSGRSSEHPAERVAAVRSAHLD